MAHIKKIKTEYSNFFNSHSTKLSLDKMILTIYYYQLFY